MKTQVNPNKKVCIIGDSTCVYVAGSLRYIKPLVITNLAVSGAAIWNSENCSRLLWLGLSEAARKAFDYIFLEIGINSLGDADVNTQYQNLVNLINVDKKPYAKLIGCTMTPIRTGLPDVRYEAWLVLNSKIMQTNAVNITGLDWTLDEHSRKMRDENNIMLAKYESVNDHVHPNALGFDLIADEYAKLIK